MDILAPWSFSNFIPLNGFHPLYRCVGSSRDAKGRFVTPRTPAFAEYRQLIERGAFCPEENFGAPNWVRTSEQQRMLEKFTRHFSLMEICHQSNLHADVEFLHTAPVTLGNRPFFLHVESFLPTFFPFFQQGKDFDSTLVSEVRGFYASLFESPLCLGIGSHLSETLAQLSEFFRSATIDGKLVLSPIGLDESYVAEGIAKDDAQFNFLFMNSAHQNPGSFALRGGESSLVLALDLLRSKQKVKFFFRTQRPPDAWLKAIGIDLDELKSYEGRQIIWITNYLSDAALKVLIARCHFLLLPSANLHSVSILSAMANGAIPIVTDTLGTDRYIKPGVNGIVIGGVKRAVWHHDEDLRLTYDNHDRYAGSVKSITAKLVREVRALLSAPDKVREMASACRQAVRQDFSGTRFQRWIVDEIGQRYSAAALKSGQVMHTLAGERWLEDITPEHFAGPPQPLLRFDAGHDGRIFQKGNIFAHLPFSRLADAGQSVFWSPLNLAHERFRSDIPVLDRVAVLPSLNMAVAQIWHRLGAHAPQLAAAASQASAEPALPMPMFQPVPAYWLDGVALEFGRRLRRHPYLFAFSQKLWRWWRRMRWAK